ncbi:hypothetical protein [Novosphingobium sp. 9]|uniref:3'-5' exonuclease n=1 Tax=Novosphingobium sp. 9 TaxID=2025349 RepID=UPI0021B5356E|nr:hypothetical protein [Novosphingobium sp. 9]
MSTAAPAPDKPVALPVALIDFEASCLPEDGQSFPIEVALARVDGRSASWLIRPLPAWQHWDWSAEAESLHGISRAMLAGEGQDPVEVLDQIAAFVEGCDVYADAEVDVFWLDLLAHAVGRAAPFPVRYLGEYFTDRGYSRPQVVAALEEAKLRLPREHLAREDAKRLALTVRLLDESTAA